MIGTSSDSLCLIPKPLEVKLTGGRHVLKQSRAGDRSPRALGFEVKLVLEQTDDKTLGPEGYEVVVTPDRITLRIPPHNKTITGPGGKDVRVVGYDNRLYPICTVEQLVRFNHRDGAIPCLVIRDKPRFPWRGFMLDSARHIQTVGFIEQILDLMAGLKLNTFHWHLTDDTAWRIPIEKYPKLIEIGAWRNSGPNRYGGFYSREQIRHIIEYASERHISVIPEIEMPGHCNAALFAYPELSCAGTVWPTGADGLDYFNAGGRRAFCASRPETFAFLEDVLAEVMDLFDSPVIHIGGDERPHGVWSKCPRCQQKMKELGLADEHHLQRWFMQQIVDFVHRSGRRTMAWSDGLREPFPQGQIVQGWHTGESEYTIASGSETVNSNNEFTYLDYPWSVESRKGKPDWMTFLLNTETVYKFDPVPTGSTPEQAARVRGGEAPLWTEVVPDDDTAFRQTFPRLIPFSEVAWSPPAGRNFPEFQRRLRPHVEHLKSIGVQCGE